jgi:endonuclease/exonuclease/phosphatase family metal-dependent hydrolase
MRLRVSARYVRAFSRAFQSALLIVGGVSAASAQTTVTINQPGTQVVFGTVRGGSYANTNDSTLLATRSSDNLEYERRALLKFDTQNTIPVGAAVSSAQLTLTVKLGSADASRAIGVHQVTQSWTEGQVTWNKKRTGESWNTPGVDIGSLITQKTVGNTPGTKVTLDVTSLVKAAVSGSLGASRYTRVVLVDLEASTSGSYREFYTPATSTAANRPTLTVTYGGAAAPPPPPPPPSGSTLRVLQWNTHHGGYGTDGVWDPDRLIRKAASFRPDIVSMNEVERYTSWGNADDPALFTSLMTRYTGQTWYYKFTTATGAARGNGNLIMSRFPFDADDTQLLSHYRAAIDVTIHVNGRAINFVSTHLDADSTPYRLQEIGELTTWARSLAEQRIVAGDINAWPGSTENATMKTTYYDSWAEAQADGTAISYPGNTAGNTRSSRIDYIYYSKTASGLQLNSSQVFDVRDANGVMPSDHRPVMSIFTVR